MLKKRILIIGAGAEQKPAYELASAMGLVIVGSDQNPEAPAFSLTQERIIASTYDAEQTVREALKFHQSRPINGVMTLASDAPMTVARVAEALGLAGISVETARLTSNKLVQLDRFRARRVPIPDFCKAASVEDVKRCIATWGYPLIIKPPDSRGARGVLRLTPGIDPAWAFKQCIAYSGTGSIVVQKFVEGPQISSESLVVNGRCYTAMYSGRNYEFLERFSPFIIENGGWLPAGINEDQRQQLDNVLQQAAEALGIVNGPMKGDLVLTDSGPVVIECAARMGGGYAVSHSIPLTHGINLIEQVIKMAIGLPVNENDLIPRYRQSAALRFFFPKPGKVVKISGFDSLDQYEWIALKKLYCKIGDVIPEVSNHTQRAGCVIALGKDMAQAEERVKKAVDQVIISTIQEDENTV